MRYLKSFNEDMDNTDQLFQEELKDFCETNLAYLLDEGTEVEVKETPGISATLNLNWYNPQTITIKFEDEKSWTEIKDHIIPFATRFNNEYEILDVIISFYTSVPLFDDTTRIRTTIKNIIEDDIKIPTLATKLDLDKPQITDISIYIKGYKQETKKGILTKIKSFFK